MSSLAFSAAQQPSVRVGLGRVLVVEDEELIRDTIGLALAEEGFDVAMAADGITALELLGGTTTAARKVAQISTW
jgi:two-component system phosphate regulon response regulator PhoB